MTTENQPPAETLDAIKREAFRKTLGVLDDGIGRHGRTAAILAACIEGATAAVVMTLWKNRKSGGVWTFSRTVRRVARAAVRDVVKVQP